MGYDMATNQSERRSAMKDQEFEVKKIRSQYASQPHTELDTLKVLDTRVRRPAIVLGVATAAWGLLFWVQA